MPLGSRHVRSWFIVGRTRMPRPTLSRSYAGHDHSDASPGSAQGMTLPAERRRLDRGRAYVDEKEKENEIK